jgi:hypothetical protein
MPRTSFSEHGEQSWLELTVTLPAGYADDLSAHLIELGSRGTSEQSAAGAPGLCKVTAYFPASADRARLLKKASAFRDRIAASSPEAAQHFQTQGLECGVEILLQPHKNIRPPGGQAVVAALPASGK